MTVEQLIKVLERLPPDLHVYHQSEGGIVDEVDVVHKQIAGDNPRTAEAAVILY